jgi:AraC-like DNA-binding protein
MTPEELLVWQRKNHARSQKAVETAARIRRDKEKLRAEEEKQRAKENPPIKKQPKFHFHFEEDWERDGPPQWVLDCWKEMKAAKIANPPHPPPRLDPMEKHFTVYEIAEAWRVPICTARRIFRNVPGVINASTPTSLTSRPWSFLRIPASLAAWVHEQRSADWSLDKRRVRLKTLGPTENTNPTSLVGITERKGITMMNQKPNALEKHYSLEEVAEAWGISVRSARRIFRDQPGVADLNAHKSSLTSRPYSVLRVSASAAARVHEQRSAGFVLGARRRK